MTEIVSVVGAELAGMMMFMASVIGTIGGWMKSAKARICPAGMASAQTWSNARIVVGTLIRRTTNSTGQAIELRKTGKIYVRCGFIT